MDRKEMLLLQYLINSINIMIPQYEDYLLSDDKLDPDTKRIRKNFLETLRKVINAEKFY